MIALRFLLTLFLVFLAAIPFFWWSRLQFRARGNGKQRVVLLVLNLLFAAIVVLLVLSQLSQLNNPDLAR